jgi:hypothetical protein
MHTKVRLGQVVHNGAYFFASKDEFLMGTYNTFEEAMKSLVLKARSSLRRMKST